MKKCNLLKIALSVASVMLLSVSVFGQNPAAPYALYDADKTTPSNIDYVTLKTGGTTMGYYALPDPVYHPNYVATGAITLGFQWNWTVNNGGTVASPVATFTENYAQITYPAAGNYVVTVAEQASAAFGGCVGSTTTMNVTVVNPPTGTTSINPGVAWQVISANASYQICSNQAAQTVTIAFNEAVPNALGSYSFQITETKELLNGAGTVIATPQVETVIQDFPLATKLKGTNLGTLPSAAFNATSPAFTFTFLTDALDVMQNAGVDSRTRYTYKVTKSGDLATNGFASNISQKSDFIAGPVEYYAFTNQTVSFIINPAPVTGPIYYVPNNFNY